MTKRAGGRHAAWGTIVGALVAFHAVAEHESQATPADLFDALDAVAMLMVASAVNRKERLEDQRDATADAREAFRDGRDHGLAEGRD